MTNPKDIDTAELRRLRADTPGCGERLHLNNAGTGLMPSGVLAVVQGHLEREAKIGGYEAADEAQDAIAAVYTPLARLLGCRERHLALVENATAAFNQAISSIPFEPGNVILTTRDDYASNQITFLSLARRCGVEVVRAPDLPEGGVDVDGLREIVRRRSPRLVAVTHVPTNSGLVQPVTEIGRVCREEDVLYLVDACQTIGQFSLDVEAIGCDFLSASGRKFLRAPRGTGVLYASDRVLESSLAPLCPDLQGAAWTGGDSYEIEPTARRFENWEFAHALVLGLGEAARYALEMGPERTFRRAMALGRRLRAGLADIDGVRVLDRGKDPCAIVTAHIAEWQPEPLVGELRRRRVNVNASSKRYGVLDFEAKGIEWALRLSPHYYNSEEEIDTVLGYMAELAHRR